MCWLAAANPAVVVLVNGVRRVIVISSSLGRAAGTLINPTNGVPVVRFDRQILSAHDAFIHLSRIELKWKLISLSSAPPPVLPILLIRPGLSGHYPSCPGSWSVEC